MKVPEFKSEEEEFEFWSTHDAADLMDEGERVEVDFSKARAKRDKRQAERLKIEEARAKRSA